MKEGPAVIKEMKPNDLDIRDVVIPEIVEGDKSPTTNGTGYVFFSISPVGEAFLQNEARPNKSVLEIGAGYSNLTIEALKNNVGSYTANDVSEEHLKILVVRIKEYFGQESDLKLKKLKLWQGKAPQELPNISEQYDAIMIDKVLHFMKPREIKQFIEWTKISLKPGGKLYVTTVSPFSQTFEPVRSQYLEKCSQGDLFPGHFQDAMKHVNPEMIKRYPNFKLPDEIVLLSRNDLVSLFQREKMEILESYSLNMPQAFQKPWQMVSDENSSMAGVIARLSGTSSERSGYGVS
ncbi:MAG: polyketide synthase -related protein [Alphaproteobacteria bacterium]|jgi:SAM-dependent methyltransferase|nr:polyketide synthase -related protein [Alphaproteobacteria bacterium]